MNMLNIDYLVDSLIESAILADSPLIQNILAIHMFILVLTLVKS